MAKTVVIQRMGQTMKEGTLVKWLRNNGDTVKKGEPIYDLEYDKASASVESPADGILEIIVEEGGTHPVGTVVAKIRKAGEAPQEPEKQEKAKTPAVKNGKSGGKTADVIVIGGGPGGYVAAIKLAMLGKKTVLVEKDTVGGTCLNRGCIPTKALLHSAQVLSTIKNSAAAGITVDGYRVDTGAVNERKNGVVKKLTGGVAFLLKSRGVEVIAGTASFAGEKTLRVTDGKGNVQEISAESIVIASGSESARIPIDGIDGKNVITSTGALDFTSLPKSMVIIGGGVIGMEIGSVYAEFGTKVTVLEALPNILGNMDGEIADAFRVLAGKRMDIHTQAKVTKIEGDAKMKSVSFEQGGKMRSVSAEKVLVCVGRTPETQALGLENAGIGMERGRIVTDDNFMTNVSGVYAIGDVNGKVLLAHAASAQGLHVAQHICGMDSEIALGLVPGCIYTSPEIASVGKTEEELKKGGVEYTVGRFPFSANGKALAMDEPEGFVKILAGKKHGEVLGAHIIGPRATDMIGELALAINMECTAEEITKTIHAHPTLSEAIMEAAEDVSGHAVHKP